MNEIQHRNEKNSHSRVSPADVTDGLNETRIAKAETTHANYSSMNLTKERNFTIPEIEALAASKKSSMAAATEQSSI